MALLAIFDAPELRERPSYPGYAASQLGEIFKIDSAGFLPMKLSKTKSGHLTANTRKNTKRRTEYAHRLVMDAWVGPSELVVDHIDNDRSNNCLHNLQYVTREENLRLMGERGRSPKNEQHAACKLSNNQVLEIRKLETQLSARKVAALYGISHAHVQNIWKRKLRKDL